MSWQLLVVLVVAVLYWLFDCWRDPWQDCAWCKGGPKRRAGGRSRKTFHFCAVPTWLHGCGGSGRVRRFGSLLVRHGLGRLD